MSSFPPAPRTSLRRTAATDAIRAAGFAQFEGRGAANLAVADEAPRLLRLPSALAPVDTTPATPTADMAKVFFFEATVR